MNFFQKLIFLGYRKICSRWIPYELTELQKKKRLDCSRKLLKRFEKEGNSFLNRIVTGDETWILFKNPESKNKSKEWRKKDEKIPERPKLNKYSKKIMLTVFWDSRGVLSADFSNTTITSESYGKLLRKLKENIIEKRENSDNVLLLHDNAKPHTAKENKKLIKKMKWENIDHPPYSPDLAPSDYHLFAPLKEYLSGKEYPNIEELSFAVNDWFSKKNILFYQSGIFKLEKKWKACIESEGNYFPKNKKNKKK